jgi:DNA-binding MarR family transcriptional regulator
MKPCTKGEMLCKMSERYPSMNQSAIQLISHVQSIGKSLSAMLNDVLSEHDLTEGKFYVISFLFSEELFQHEAPSPSQIADHIGVTRGTVTGLLDGLERDGFVERTLDPRDRRALTIKMTDKSRVFLDSFLPTITKIVDRFIPLSGEEREIAIELLSRVDTALINEFALRESVGAPE